MFIEGIQNPTIQKLEYFKNRTFWRLDFEWLGPIENRAFCPGFKWLVP